MPTIPWEKLADDLIHSAWGQDGNDTQSVIRPMTDARLQTILLLDIARSLRVLRCQNFKNIPSVLTQIKINTHKPRKYKRKVAS